MYGNNKQQEVLFKNYNMQLYSILFNNQLYLIPVVIQSIIVKYAH